MHVTDLWRLINQSINVGVCTHTHTVVAYSQTNIENNAASNGEAAPWQSCQLRHIKVI